MPDCNGPCRRHLWLAIHKSRPADAHTCSPTLYPLPQPLPLCSFASIAKLAGEQLGPHIVRIIPRLYRYLYDPNGKVRAQQDHSGDTPEHTAITPEYPDTIACTGSDS